MSLRDHRLPLLLAAVVTGLNALKPAAVDDTAYLLFARHLAADPLHPYSFELFWYSQPQPAMEILLPPVLPYWLAGGIALFGEHPALLKLWLFPFAWLLCLAGRSLLRRFAEGMESTGLIVFTFSPLVLPLFGFMLDVPALALGAAAVALFVRGCDRGRVWPILLAGACCALAMQTKYSMLTVPCVIVAYGFTRLGQPGSVRAMLYALVAVSVAAGMFVTWEVFLVRQHGTSHFLYHLRDNAGGEDLSAKLETRFGFAPALLSQFGGLVAGISLAAAAGVGWPRWVRVTSAVVAGLFLISVALLPYSTTAPLGTKFDLAYVGFTAFGVGVLISLGLGLGRLLIRNAADANTFFLVAWLVIETLGMFGMTPFPAARRVIGVGLAAAVLLFHLSARLTTTGLSLPRWGVGFAAAYGLTFWAVDCWDAQPEQVLSQRAADIAKPSEEGTVWFTGHWGFQYHCDRLGMRHLVVQKGGTPMRAGDRLVLPVLPDPEGFFRPWPQTEPLPRWDMRLELLGEIEWRDALSAQTIPNLYGGSLPLRGRDHPRFRVAVYRVLRDWRP